MLENNGTAGGAEIDLGRPAPPVEDPDAYRRRMVSSTVAYTALLATALTTEQAADRLGVDPSRIRQRIAERTVWAIKDGRRWLLPAVQFDGNRMVRGLDTLLPLLLQGEHPLTVQGLLTTSQAVLAVDGEPESILDWLRSGGDIAAAAAVVDAHRWAAV